MSAALAGVAVDLLGRFEVRVDGCPRPVAPGQMRILLAALALEAGRPVPVTSLIGYLWEEDTLPDNPRAGVQNNVQRLRRILGADKIVTCADAYTLDVPPERVDAHRFLTVSDTLAAGPRTRDAVEQALGLWHGKPLADVGSPALLRDYGPGLNERYMTVLETRTDLDIADGRYSRAVADLRELTTRYPLRESLWSRLLTALHRSGRLAEALDTYEQVRTLLAEELGTDPAPDLQQLHHDLLTAEPAGSSGHGRGLAPRRAPRQLPHPTPGFVGREPELAALDAFLTATETEADPATIAVVHGIGGIGKTALTVHWAYRNRDRFPDGDLYLDLRGFGPADPVDPGEAAATILRSLDVPAADIPAAAGERSALLRTRAAGKRMLIVLDNARDADQVRPLLPGPDSVVVVTSRNRLRGLSTLQGAFGIALPELSDTQAITLLTHAIGNDRETPDPSDLSRLADLCGGLPLALRIAAEHWDSQPAAGTALDTLAGDEPVADLRTVLSWSCTALTDRPAELFRRLGLHPGTDITALVAAVLLDTDPAEAVRCLERLTAAHLIEPHHTGIYRMHDLVREYAVECAATEPAAQRHRTVRRLLDWYVHTIASARDLLGFGRPFAPTEAVDVPRQPLPRFEAREQVLQWCENERETVLHLARIGVEEGLDEHVWQLAWVHYDFLSSRQLYQDRVSVGEFGQTSANRLGSPTAISRMAYVLGPGYARFGRHREADAVLRTGLENAQVCADHELMSLIHGQLGTRCGDTGDYDGAVAHFEQAIAAASHTTRPELAGHALLNFGYTAFHHGDHSESARRAEQALAIYQQHGFAVPAAVAMSNAAENYHLLGDHDLAIEYASRAAAGLRDLRAEDSVDALMTLAEASVATDRLDQARSALDEAREVCGPTDSRLARIQELSDRVMTAERPPPDR